MHTLVHTFLQSANTQKIYYVMDEWNMNETNTTYLYWIDVTFLGLRGYAQRHPASEIEAALADGRLKQVVPDRWREKSFTNQKA